MGSDDRIGAKDCELHSSGHPFPDAQMRTQPMRSSGVDRPEEIPPHMF